MRVLVSGATGLVGRAICKKLLNLNHSLLVVGRSPELKFRQSFPYPCDYVSWEHLNPESLKSVEAVINLAGESIASGRWTKTRKERLLNSRVKTVNTLYDLFSKAQHWPKIFIGASAIGFYGDAKEQLLNEDSKKGSGFLAEICQQWEEAYSHFNNKTRLVILRLGVVLSLKGGFLSALNSIFSMGIGGRIGNGKQWMSWIHIDDLIEMICHSLESSKIQGTYNAVSPSPITNMEWTHLFAKALKTVAPLPIPRSAFKLLAGEMSELALNSQKVSPEKFMQTGFSFLYPSPKEALNQLYDWKQKSQDQFFYSETWINKPIKEVFNFFSEAQNLEQITPPWVNFKIKDMSTTSIEKGTIINYQIKIHGIPQIWQTEITKWEPPHCFVDNQKSGPYSRWAHTHEFKELCGGTLIVDQVAYRLPMGHLGRIVASSFVNSDIKKIFAYRQNKIFDVFQNYQPETTDKKSTPKDSSIHQGLR